MPNMQRKDHITQYTTLSTPRLFGNTVLHFLGNTSTTHLGAVCFRVVLTHIKEMKNAVSLIKNIFDWKRYFYSGYYFKVSS